MFTGDLAAEEELERVAGGSLIPEGVLPLWESASPEIQAEVNPPHWNLLEERRLDPARPSHRGYRRTSDFWVSTTDPYLRVTTNQAPGRGAGDLNLSGPWQRYRRPKAFSTA